MTDQTSAATQAMIGWLDTAIEMEGDPDQKLGLQRCRKMIRDMQQENERLTRHLQALPEHIWDQYIGGPRP